MNQSAVLDIIVESLLTAIKVASPALVAIMLTGVVVSLIQAATQINEQTLSFIPKILALTLALILAGPWIVQTMIFFTSRMFMSIALVTR